jgi:hypothetical protein
VAKDFKKLRQLTEDLQKARPRAVRLPDSHQQPFQEWSDSLNALRRDDELPPISPQPKPAQRTSHSKQDETEFAIESAAQELRKNPELTRDHLYARLFGPEDERAPSLKKHKWVTNWTLSRFLKKIWKAARERAKLDPLARKGRPPEK